MREARYEDQVRATIDRRRLPQVEKEVDDPSTPPASALSHDAQADSTLTTLSRLLASHAAISPEASRASSYALPARHFGYARHVNSSETAALPDHLFTRGLREGRHSDITVRAFGVDYKLHRLVLDRAPFFATALSAPWLEANAKDMLVRPDEIDANITQTCFELALKRLYRGFADAAHEDAHAVGLFATGCWLEMPDLIDASVESILRQMSPDSLAPLIKLVTKNYYGRPGDKILASAKAMLCRDGWKMPVRYWDGIPGDIVREIVGGDGFFVDGEWERWVLAKRILDRQLKARAVEAGLVDPVNRKKLLKTPDSRNLTAIRFDGVSRRSAPLALDRGLPDHVAKYITLYTHPSIEPLLVLLDEGIHYVHLDFEQLQFIRLAKDIVGFPVMPDKVVSNALWQQMELRQRVINAREPDLELGLALEVQEAAEPGKGPINSNDPASFGLTHPEGKGKAKVDTDHDASHAAAEPESDSGSWDGNGKPRKFWIPSSDCNIVMGGNADPVVATPNIGTGLQPRHTSRLSTTVQPEDVQWASDFPLSTTAARPGAGDGGLLHDATVPPPAVSYTHLPPFRFSAEFPSPRLLKEKKRVYSRTVFYAGSLWNIYIQKVASARSTKQLGVYLHRAKEREAEEAVFGATGAGLQQGNVEGRIGLLERDLTDHGRRRRRDVGDDITRHSYEDGESSGSAADVEGGALSRASRLRDLLSSSAHRPRKTGQADTQHSESSPLSTDYNLLTPSSDLDSDSSVDGAASLPRIPPSLATRSNPHVPALPPYVDARPTIRTYFKIYSPSRGGRMLSVYESAPDKFNFSQSWGWKSSTLMLDEGLLSQDDADQQIGVLEATTSAREDGTADGSTVAGTGLTKEEGTVKKTSRSAADGKLRFMVVIGNI